MNDTMRSYESLSLRVSPKWRYMECADSGGALAGLPNCFWVTHNILSKAASLPPHSKSSVFPIPMRIHKVHGPVFIPAGTAGMIPEIFLNQIRIIIEALKKISNASKKVFMPSRKIPNAINTFLIASHIVHIISKIISRPKEIFFSHCATA